MPGAARRLVTFFCIAKRKSPKKRRPRLADFPCAPQPNRALRNSRIPRSDSARSTSPGLASSLGGSQGAKTYRNLVRLRLLRNKEGMMKEDVKKEYMKKEPMIDEIMEKEEIKN